MVKRPGGLFGSSLSPVVRNLQETKVASKFVGCKRNSPRPLSHRRETGQGEGLRIWKPVLRDFQEFITVGILAGVPAAAVGLRDLFFLDSERSTI